MGYSVCEAINSVVYFQFIRNLKLLYEKEFEYLLIFERRNLTSREIYIYMYRQLFFFTIANTFNMTFLLRHATARARPTRFSDASSTWAKVTTVRVYTYAVVTYLLFCGRDAAADDVIIWFIPFALRGRISVFGEW